MSSSWIDVRALGDNGLADVRLRFANGTTVSIIPNTTGHAATVELALLTDTGTVWGATVWPSLPIGELLLKVLVICYTASGAASAFDALVADPTLKPHQQQWPG